MTQRAPARRTLTGREAWRAAFTAALVDGPSDRPGTSADRLRALWTTPYARREMDETDVTWAAEALWRVSFEATRARGLWPEAEMLNMLYRISAWWPATPRAAAICVAAAPLDASVEVLMSIMFGLSTQLASTAGALLRRAFIGRVWRDSAPAQRRQVLEVLLKFHYEDIRADLVAEGIEADFLSIVTGVGRYPMGVRSRVLEAIIRAGLWPDDTTASVEATVWCRVLGATSATRKHQALQVMARGPQDWRVGIAMELMGAPVAAHPLIQAWAVAQLAQHAVSRRLA